MIFVAYLKVLTYLRFSVYYFVKITLVSSQRYLDRNTFLKLKFKICNKLKTSDRSISSAMIFTSLPVHTVILFRENISKLPPFRFFSENILLKGNTSFMQAWRL
mgnify:CR=1 FL=1